MISEALDDYGPMFFDEMLDELNQLPTHLEQGLVELEGLDNRVQTILPDALR